MYILIFNILFPGLQPYEIIHHMHTLPSSNIYFIIQSTVDGLRFLTFTYTIEVL